MILHIVNNKGSDKEIDLNNKRPARLEILSETRKYLLTQVARIKQNIEKVLDVDKSFAELIQILFYEQSITIVSILTSLSMTFSTIALAVTCVFGGKVSPAASGSPPSKDEGL